MNSTLRLLLCLSLNAVVQTESVGGLPKASVQNNTSNYPPSASKIGARIAEQYPSAVSISPDGTWILLKTAKSVSDELTVLDVRSGRTIASTDSKESQVGISWSVDGLKIAYLAAAGNGDVYRLYIWNLVDNLVSQVNAPSTNVAVQPPRWNPDGTQLAYLVGSFDDSTIWIVNVDQRISPRPLIGHVRAKSDFEWSPDAKQMAVVLRSSSSTLRLISPENGKELAQISTSRMVGSEIRDLSWAPSGQAIAVAGRISSDFTELQKVDLAMHKAIPCVSTAGNVLSPRVAPDSRTILYSVSRDAQLILYSTTCDGSAPKLMGFDSGTTRVIRFVKSPQSSTPAKSMSFAVVHTGLNEPPCLYRILTDSAKTELIYRPRYSTELRSPSPRLIGITGPNLNVIPTVSWPVSETSRPLDTILVEVHGGPHLESNVRWEFLPSFLASLGVELLSPNYQGSSGYGHRYEESGNTADQIREIVAVCRFAKTLRGPHTRVILMGTSYGSFLAASAAASDPQCINGVVLLSLLNINPAHPYWTDANFPIICFQGVNDPLPPQKADAILASFFGRNGGASKQIACRAMPGEGHVFRHSSSWEEVYSAMLDMVMQVSDLGLVSPSN
jgi:dipeptidyl aminopeptidase/acylaminoacyl peptidase